MVAGERGEGSRPYLAPGSAAGSGAGPADGFCGANTGKETRVSSVDLVLKPRGAAEGFDQAQWHFREMPRKS